MPAKDRSQLRACSHRDSVVDGQRAIPPRSCKQPAGHRNELAMLTQVPKRVSRVPDEILQPSSQWKDGAAFDKSLRHLASLYSANFKK